MRLSLVRHPLYSGNALLLIGFTLASGQWWAALTSAAFWWFYYPPAIDYEDRKLHKTFGEVWEQWGENVPAVIPSSWRPRGASDWSFRTSLRRNGEPFIALFLLGCLVHVGLQLG